MSDGQNNSEVNPINAEYLEDKPEETSLVKVPTQIVEYDLYANKTYDEVMQEGHNIAKVLVVIMKQRPNALIVNDKLYPQFEDWQLLARFHGCVPKVKWVKYTTEYGVPGFECGAELIRIRDGAVISYAESMCLIDEPRWAGKPYYAVKSMAQTRACSKVCRQVFSWVMLLGGVSPTPAEEITEDMLKVETKSTVKFKTVE